MNDGPRNPPFLEASGLGKACGGVRAPSQVGLTLAPGEIHALLGENGAGKSASIECLSGAARPGGGAVRMRRVSPNDTLDRRFKAGSQAGGHIMRVLVVEDEEKVASFLKQALEESGYAADVAHDGQAGLEQARAAEYDLIVLDHLLPGLTGREVCRRLRAEGNTAAILMVTARDALEDKVAGLDAGADDYLTKPFSIDEMLARLRALLRRGEGRGSSLLSVEDLTLDSRTRLARRGERAFELSAREYALLDYLMRNARRPVTRAMIAEHVWGFDFDSGSNVIDVYISYLRAKIDRDTDRKLIRTLRHVGYQLG